MDLPKHIRAVVSERRDLTHDLWIVRLRTDEPIPFKAGQYVTVGLLQDNNLVERPYSAASAPEEGELEFFIEEVEGVTTRFQAVNEGMRSQSVAARQINEAMVPVANGTKETQVALEEFIKATAYLRESVELLNQEISQFTV